MPASNISSRSQAEISAGNSRPLDDRVNYNEQSQCFDDDSFIQTAFGNPDLTCEAVASQGLCSTLAASGIDNRCCHSCEHHRRNMRDDSEEIVHHVFILLEEFKRRRMQDSHGFLFPDAVAVIVGQPTCPLASFADRVNTASAICCAESECPGDRVPERCSFDCARAFTTLLSDCRGILGPLLGDDLHKFQEFGNLCTNLDVRSLVNAIHTSHCWFCGDGINDEDEQCDTGDDLSECSSSPCQNGGECYDGIREVLGNQDADYTCQCPEGFAGNACEEEVPPVYLCHGDERVDCAGNATCTHTGPGTHDCDCFVGFSGDGHTCAQQGETRCLADCTLEVRCPPLAPLEGGTVELTNGNIALSVATYTCESGNPPSDGNATRTCQADGSWSGTAPTQCGVPCGSSPSDCMTSDGCRSPAGRCVGEPHL